jgi:outer membrane protein assembly factor BamB
VPVTLQRAFCFASLPLLCGAVAAAQMLTAITVDGPAHVLEGTSAQYTATAHFDDGGSFEVTLFSDWSVEPGHLATIDQTGELTAGLVLMDQVVEVVASFTWQDVTEHGALEVTIVNVPPDDGPDPWPFWGRTATRLGRTSSIGPQTPHIAWTVAFTATGLKANQLSLNRDGLLFIGRSRGVAVIDTAQREILWEAWGDNAQGVAILGDRAYWATSNPESTIFCYEANTGEPVWTYQGGFGFNAATPVISEGGVLYISDGVGTMFARWTDDGSEMWTASIGTYCTSAPGLASTSTLGSGGGGGGGDYLSLDPTTGAPQWSFPTGRGVHGISPILGDRIYVASSDEYVYCLNRFTGEEIWRYWCEQIQNGSVAVGHDGMIYNATSGNQGILFAITPEGEEHWRLLLPGLAGRQPPIVAGDGTIYVACRQWTGSLYYGHVLAVRPDGTVLWQRQLPPGRLDGSPILGPDGTLYVGCNDGNIYAFKDVTPGDVDADGDVDQADLGALLAAYGSCLGDAGFIHGADFNEDECIDQSDLGALLANYGI